MPDVLVEMAKNIKREVRNLTSEIERLRDLKTAKLNQLSDLKTRANVEVPDVND